MIDGDRITGEVIELIKKAVTDLPNDVEDALRKAKEAEKNKRAGVLLDNILRNIKVARENSVPMCQDTGILVFYVRVGGDAGVDAAVIRDAITAAVRKATEEVPLRPNAVHPLTRENSGDNTGAGIPVIEYGSLEDEGCVEITVLPKGAGSENASALGMLNASDGVEGIKRFVAGVVEESGGRACPPLIVGVGVGGTADKAMSMAKKSLLREIGSRNPVKGFRELEEGLYKEINDLGLGPMGIGGSTTCLAVHIEHAYCHTASLPVAVNLQCWAARKATVRICGEKHL